MIKKCSSLILIFVVSTSFIIPKLSGQESCTVYETPSDQTIMPSTWILELYQLMKDTHEILVQNKIDYWIQGGTLLGAVRHKGLIPWDDDIDINLKLSDEKAFLSILSEFIALDYHVDTVPLGYKIVSPHTYHFGEIAGAPCIDVFFTYESEEKVLYDPSRDVDWMHRDKGPIYIRNEELYPLKTYQLGDCVVLGPKNPIPFLNACFSTDWPNTAICWNHFFPITVAKQKIELTELDKEPAKPIGPLYDRVKKSKTVRVYANMIGDLFHYGHMEFLKKASKLGTELIVGLVSDEVATNYKRKPILSLEERVKCVKGCKYVDKVIFNTSVVITEEFLSFHEIDYVVHGDDFDVSALKTYYSDPLKMNILRLTEYIPGISSTEIIQRVQLYETLRNK